MLNYLGPNIGPGPVTSMLPPVNPGTIPAGVPGAPQSPAPLPPTPPIHMRGHHSAHPSALAAIMKAPSGPGAVTPPPAPLEYKAITQDDGSVLLHRLNPDGSLGPVVRLIPPIKVAGQSQGAAK